MAQISVRPAFASSQFAATKWATADDKALFCERLARFAEAGFPRSRFTKAMYRQLSNMFGHIAHYDINGFYAEWFQTPGDQANWWRHLLSYRHVGDPAWTWSDAETAFGRWAERNPSARAA